MKKKARPVEISIFFSIIYKIILIKIAIKNKAIAYLSAKLIYAFV